VRTGQVEEKYQEQIKRTIIPYTQRSGYYLLIFSGVCSACDKCKKPVQTMCRQVQFIKFVKKNCIVNNVKGF